MKCENGWAELHPNLLEEIVRHVESFGNYVRLRAVCKSWMLDIPKNPIHIKNPWLVLPFEDEDETLRPFFNVGENELYHFELPEMRNTMFRGSYYQWLITIGIDDTLRILNPFTREQFDLPPLSALPDVKSYEPDRLGEEYTILGDDGLEFACDKSDMQKSHVAKIIISSLPDHDDTDSVAIAIYGEKRRLAYYKTGDKRWTDIPITELQWIFQDAIFHEGKLYAINSAAELYEYDMKTMLGGIGKVQRPPGLNLGNMSENPKYLVATPDGLLMVLRRTKGRYVICNGEHIYKRDRTYEFEIYKLKSGEWSLVNSLGNYVILLGHNSSLCISPGIFLDGKGNRIYFTDDNLDGLYSNVYGGQDNGYYDLDDGSFNQLFPHLEFIKPYPTWLLHKDLSSAYLTTVSSSSSQLPIAENDMVSLTSDHVTNLSTLHSTPPIKRLRDEDDEDDTPISKVLSPQFSATKLKKIIKIEPAE